MATMKFFNVLQPPTQGADDGTYYVKNGDKFEPVMVSEGVPYEQGDELTIEEVTAQAIVALQNRIIALEKLITDGLLGNIEIMNLDIIENFNIWGKSNLILTGNTPPDVIPDFVGQTFIDTANKVAYTATGINSVNDWK